MTTQQVRAEEQAMVDWVRRTRGTVAPIVAAADGHAFRDEQLNDQQRAAVRHVLGSRDRVTTVIGKSGTGKTRLIREAVAAMEARGHKVIVLAPGSETARDTLPKEGLSRTDTVARFLIDSAAHWDCRGGVWWVDEAGLLSSPALSRLCTLAQEWDARLVLSGDPMQHRAVERGDALVILQRYAGLEAVTVGKILRQSGLHREAVEHFSEGRMVQGFERLDALGAIVEVEDEGERHRLLAGDYLQAVRDRATALVVSPTHAEGRKVTDLIRQALRDEGKLAGEEREVLRLRRIDLTAGQRGDAQLYRQGWVLEATQHMPGWAAGQRLTVAGVRDGVLYLRDRYGEVQTFDPAAGWAERFHAYESETVQLAVGDRVRITKNGRSVDRRNKLSNGTIHTLEGFTESGDLRLDNGVVLADDFGHLTHGYATTSHSAQSKTVERIFVAEGTESFLAASREQFYVSVGRGSKLVRVYTDNREGLLEAVHASSRRAAALDLVPAEKDEKSEREAGTRQQEVPCPTPPPRTSDRLKSPSRSPSSRQVETLRGYLPELPEPEEPERDGPDMDL